MNVFVICLRILDPNLCFEVCATQPFGNAPIAGVHLDCFFSALTLMLPKSNQAMLIHL